MSTEMKSLIETSATRGRSNRSSIHSSIPKIDNTEKTKIMNLKSNIKVNNVKPKQILITPAKFEPSQESKINYIQPTTEEKRLRILKSSSF